MKKIIILALLLIGSLSMFASEGVAKNPLHIEQNKKLLIAHANSFYNNDPCLQASLDAMNAAFTTANQQTALCQLAQTTPQGYADCATFWTNWRRLAVGFIYANLVSCPDEIIGWQTKQQKQ
jgi:hypothetical protein